MCNITLHKNNCVDVTKDSKFLGYYILKGEKRPHPVRVKPISNLPIPTIATKLQRATDVLLYFAQWIPQFSDKIKPSILVSQFPINDKARQALELLNDDLVFATFVVIDKNASFVIKTDASNNAVSASHNQKKRPVAFFSRMLSKSEICHSNVKKMATAIVEARRK